MAQCELSCTACQHQKHIAEPNNSMMRWQKAPLECTHSCALQLHRQHAGHVNQRAYDWHLHAAVTVGRDSGSAATPPNMTPDLPVEHNCAACALTTNGTKSSGKPSPLPGTHWYKPPGRCDRLHSGLRDHASHSGMLAQLQACADAVSK